MNSLIIGTLDEKHTQRENIYDVNNISPTLTAAMGMGDGLVPLILEDNMNGYKSAECKCVGNMGSGYEMANRVYDENNISPTLRTLDGGGTHIMTHEVDYQIRKLTPKECFRLMGVHDEEYEKLTVSDTQKYKQAGNSIVVDVLMSIFENMFINETKSGRLF